MNKHILMVVKWMHDKNSVTQQELDDNREAAYADAKDAAVYAAYADADAAYKDADAAYAAYKAAAYAAAEAAHTTAYAAIYGTHATATEKWLERYFELGAPI